MNGASNNKPNQGNTTKNDYADFPLPDYDSLTVSVVNQDRKIGAKACFVAENRLAEDKTPILSYSSEVDAPREQLRLLKNFAEAKDYLREIGVTDLDAQLSKESDVMQDIMDRVDRGIANAEAAARKAKIRRIAKRMGTGLITGTVMGLAVQEFSALFNPKVLVYLSYNVI